jgi:hypothetical protein
LQRSKKSDSTKPRLLLVGSAPMLELSRAAEAAGYWPLIKARRVRRVLGLPVLYVGDSFAPRRATFVRAEIARAGWRRLVVTEPRVGPVPALRASRTTVW